eukprot:snap_masked-scaffold_17-processed-gene-4.15-mRNA-1 protein AED:0.01 eAED:0.01 QI:0/-1/0/1/-1/1/1/0/384
MGIKGLMKLIQSEAPNSLTNGEAKNYMGRVIAIDASMQLYQFMSMVRIQSNAGSQLLSNSAGEVTSHILGFFHRTISLMEKGIKPVFVFDGKPPQLKSLELSKRKEIKKDALEEISSLEEKAKEGDITTEEMERLNKAKQRSLTVTREHNKDVQRLLKLMGVPVVLAPGEAEAQCAWLTKQKKVFGTGTEDMDALTFGTPVLLRNLTYAESRKLPVIEINYEVLLKGLELNDKEFVDLCILCGCDYANSIKGIGPKTSWKLIKEHKSIEKIIEHLEAGEKKYEIPGEFKNAESLDEIRNLFLDPDVLKELKEEFKWGKVDDQGLINFLVEEMQFDLTRVQNGLKRLKKSKEKTNQKRLDSFFTILPKKNLASQKKKPTKKVKKK